MKPLILFGLRHWRTISAFLLAGATVTFFILFPPAAAFIAGITVLSTASTSAILVTLSLMITGGFNLAVNALSEIKDGFRIRTEGPVHGKPWDMLHVFVNATKLSALISLVAIVCTVPFAILLGPEVLLFSLAVGGVIGTAYFLFMALVDITIRFDNLFRQGIQALDATAEKSDYGPAYMARIINSFGDENEEEQDLVPQLPRTGSRPPLPKEQEENQSKLARLCSFFSCCPSQPRKIVQNPHDMSFSL